MERPDDPKDHWHMEELFQQRFGAEERTSYLPSIERELDQAARFHDVIKSWGFNVVRLPFYYDLLGGRRRAGRADCVLTLSNGWILSPGHRLHKLVFM